MVQGVARSGATELIPHDMLVHVPGFTAGGLTAPPVRLHGGTVNTSFRVQTSTGRFVVRIHDALARTLGADHEREAQLHAAAAAAGLAPRLMHVDIGHRFMVMEHVAGATWNPEDFARPERHTRLGAALHLLHAVEPPAVAPFDIPAVLGHHHERLSAALPEERAWLAQLMERASMALEESGTRQRPKALVHNDLCHANLIGEERLYLLDWEYAAVADPLFDLASVLAYYPEAAAHAERLLDASHLSAVATPEMLRHATWLYILLSYLWYRSRRLTGPPPSATTRAAEEMLLKRLGRGAQAGARPPTSAD